MPQSRRSPQEGGPALAGLEFAAALLPLWGFPPDADIALAGEQGTNNRTFLVRHGQQRYVLRVSGFLSVAEVRAEHRILRWLRQGGLPFQVPEPVAAPGGRTVVETPAGPAAVCRWLPGVRPLLAPAGETGRHSEYVRSYIAKPSAFWPKPMPKRPSAYSAERSQSAATPEISPTRCSSSPPRPTCSAHPTW